MIVWRIIRATYADSAFGGFGAADHPGRWNHRGRRIAYASDSPALAMLEILANAETSAALRDRVIVRATFPDEFLLVLPNEDLPEAWQRDPPSSSTRDLGEAWRLRGDSLALSVPSAVMPLQRNVLIDPEHPDFHTLEVDAPVPLTRIISSVESRIHCLVSDLRASAGESVRANSSLPNNVRHSWHVGTDASRGLTF